MARYACPGVPCPSLVCPSSLRPAGGQPHYSLPQPVLLSPASQHLTCAGYHAPPAANGLPAPASLPSAPANLTHPGTKPNSSLLQPASRQPHQQQRRGGQQRVGCLRAAGAARGCGARQVGRLLLRHVISVGVAGRACCRARKGDLPCRSGKGGAWQVLLLLAHGLGASFGRCCMHAVPAAPQHARRSMLAPLFSACIHPSAYTVTHHSPP